MNSNVMSKQAEPTFPTVEEKILLEKQLPFNPRAKRGPTSGLYFHELAEEKTSGQKSLQFFGSIFLGILFLITFPVIALIIKLFSRQSIFNKTTVTGQRGVEFELIQYPKSFLKKANLYKLPSVINIWKGELDLVGPQAYPATWCNMWNNRLSDFYKRFALKPGLVELTEPIDEQDDFGAVGRSLKKELRYVARPSLKVDFRRILGRS